MSIQGQEFIRRPRSMRVIEDYVPQKIVCESATMQVGDRRVEVFGIDKKQMKSEFKKALGKFMEPVIKLRDLVITWNEYVIQNKVPQEFYDRGKLIFDTIKSEYTPLNVVKSAVKEELYKEIFKKTPITWKIPKKYVPVVQQHFTGFDVFRDYYFPQKEVPFMHGIPRFEVLKGAIQTVLDAQKYQIEEEDDILLRPLDYVLDEEPFPHNPKNVLEHAVDILERVSSQTRLALHIHEVCCATSEH